MIQKLIAALAFLFFGSIPSAQSQSSSEQPPMKIAIVGLVHTHVHWILGRMKDGDFEIVGIVEPNKDLAKRYAEQYGYSMDLVYDAIDQLWDNYGGADEALSEESFSLMPRNRTCLKLRR